MGAPCTAIRGLRTSLFCVGEHLLPAGYRLGRHTHARPGIVVGVAGAWVGEVGRREHACGLGDVVVLPDGATHVEKSGAHGGRCLLLSLVDRDGLEPDTRRTLERDRRVTTPAATRLALRIAAELRAPDDLTGEAIDALALELFATLGPLTERSDSGRWLNEIREALDAGFLAPTDVGSLAESAGRSREHVQRSFRSAFGLPPGAYVRARRLDHAARLLGESELGIAAIAAECGFTDQSHLTRLFRARFGKTPGRFRRELRR